jgi:hypothetical protein
MKADAISVLHIQKVAGIAGSENHLLTLLPRLREYGYQPTMLVLADRNDRPSPFVESMRTAGISTDVMMMLGDVDPWAIGRYPEYRFYKTRFQSVALQERLCIT